MRSAARRSEAKAASIATPAFRDTFVRRSVREQVGNKLAAMIASGILRVGDALPGERDLAMALNVSRESVRSAIQALAARGILQVAQGTRTRVVKAEVGAVTIGFATARAVDAYEIDDVHAARLLVEREVVAAAARRMDGETLQELEKLLKAQQAAINDPIRYLISDREFHVTIYRQSGNRLLADFATDLYAYVIDRRRLAVSRPGAIAINYRDHLAIFQALRDRDVNGAVTAFTRHTERIYDTTRPMLDTRFARS